MQRAIVVLFCAMLNIGSYHTAYCSPFSAQQLRNLTAFTKLYGYVRHFHPTQAAQRADWDKIAVKGSMKVLHAADDSALLDSLRVIFAPITPYVCLGLQPCDVYIERGSALYYWEHIGYAGSKKELSFNQQRYAQPKVKKLKTNTLNWDSLTESMTLKGELVDGIYFTLPLAVPRVRADYAKVDIKAMSMYHLDSLSTRLGGVIVAWNIFQHFYPFFNETHTDWGAALNEALIKVAVDSSNLDFQLTLQRMLARLKDGHTMVSFPAGTVMPMAEMPFVTCWREGQLMVWHIVDTIKGIETGDIIIGIDGQPTASFMAEQEQWVCGSATQASLNELNAITCLRGEEGSSVGLKIKKPSGGTVTINVTRRYINWGRFLNRKGTIVPPVRIKELEENIWLVNGTTVTKADLRKYRSKLKNAKGIVVEMRGYPSPGSFRFFRQLTPNGLRTMKLYRPVVVAPREIAQLNTLKDMSRTYRSKKPHFGCPTVFLTNHWAMSAGDHMMYYASQFDSTRKVIMGQPTAGSNGVANYFMLPGNITIRFTGMYVANLDGSQFHGIGVLPDIECKPTIDATVKGEDNCLDNALNWIRLNP